MAEYYTMKIAGLERRLEKFPVNEKMDIAAFIIFGDVELTIAGCEELRKKLPEFDVNARGKEYSYSLRNGAPDG